MPSKRLHLGKVSTVLESTLPRAIDVALVVLLLRSLAPEVVGLLESSQAIVAPLMILFLSPEQILYKELSSWREGGGGGHVARVGALRHFCWLKGVVGAALAVALSIRGGAFNAAVLSAFLWAFSRTLAPQIIGIDRDYLRISGRTGQTLLLVLAQKLLFFAGVVAAVTCLHGHELEALAGAGVASVLVSAALGAVLARRVDGRGRDRAGARREGGTFGVAAVFRETFTRFSIWSHVDYVIATTVETLDVFTLGVLGFAKRTIGIYGAAVRVANFAFALPTAANLWFGMRIGQAKPDHALRRSLAAMNRPTGILLGLSVVQTVALAAAAPLIAQVLGTTRWTDPEKLLFTRCLTALALGTGIYTGTFAVMTWLKLVCDVRSLFIRVFAPWLAFTAALYFHYGWAGDVVGIAWSNIACYGFYVLLTTLFIMTAARPSRG